MTTTLKREVTKSILSVVFPYKTDKTIFRPCLQLYQSIVRRGDWLWKTEKTSTIKT